MQVVGFATLAEANDTLRRTVTSKTSLLGFARATEVDVKLRGERRFVAGVLVVVDVVGEDH